MWYTQHGQARRPNQDKIPFLQVWIQYAYRYQTLWRYSRAISLDSDHVPTGLIGVQLEEAEAGVLTIEFLLSSFLHPTLFQYRIS